MVVFGFLQGLTTLLLQQRRRFLIWSTRPDAWQEYPNNMKSINCGTSTKQKQRFLPVFSSHTIILVSALIESTLVVWTPFKRCWRMKQLVVSTGKLFVQKEYEISKKLFSNEMLVATLPQSFLEFSQINYRKWAWGFSWVFWHARNLFLRY